MTSARGRAAAGTVVLALWLGAGPGAAVPDAAAAAEVETPPVVRLAGADRVATAVAVSREVFDTADVAVVARDDDFADALTAAPLARQLGGPLLLTPSDALTEDVRDELARLDVTEVVVLGGRGAVGREVEEELAELAEVRRVAGADRYATAAAVAAEIEPSDGLVVVSGESAVDALGAAPLAAELGWPMLLTEPDALPDVTADAVEARHPGEVVVVGGTVAVGDGVLDGLDDVAPTRRLAGADRWSTAVAVHREALARVPDSSELWLATGRAFPDALAAGPAVAARGTSLLLVDGDDLRDPLDTAHHLRDVVAGVELDRIVVLGGPGAVTDDLDWQLDVVLGGRELPRGGFTLFPRHLLVAFYGSHRSPRLGVLGESPPEGAYDRLIAQAQPYEAGPRVLLPTFELITDVAQASAGDDGDYSAPSTVDEIRPWLEAARRDGVYLLLDIQPGRSDFLTLLRRYDELLVEPDVGVALDPEWRMDPGEVPGETVGEVDADEVNAVADHLAAIVREHDLPQKLLVVHQFQTRMVVDKPSIRAPAELSVMFHMDGQGGRAAKQSTYRAVRDLTGTFSNGFKLFYDEDPDTYAPADVLRFDVLPDLVSYQ